MSGVDRMREEKGKPLNVVPMKMGKSQITGAVDTEVLVLDYFLSQFSDARTGV